MSIGFLDMLNRLLRVGEGVKMHSSLGIGRTMRILPSLDTTYNVNYFVVGSNLHH